MFTLLQYGANGWGDEILFGLLTTIGLSVGSFIFGLFVGLFIAMAKLNGSAIAIKSANIYTTLMRNLPELLIIYLFFFGGNSAIMSVASIFGYNGYFEIPPFLMGVIVIGLISGAYSSEVFRGAIMSIEKGQYESAYSLGISKQHAFNRIILPQAIRQAIPGLGNIWQLALKDTALISITGLTELMRVSREATNAEREPFLFFITVAILFLVLTSLSNRVQNRIEIHFNKGQI